MTAWPLPVTLTISSSLSRTCSLMNTSDLEVCTCTVAICDAVTFTEYLKRKKKINSNITSNIPDHSFLGNYLNTVLTWKRTLKIEFLVNHFPAIWWAKFPAVKFSTENL